MHTREYIQTKLKKILADKNELRAETNFILENILKTPNVYEDMELSSSAKQMLDEVLKKRQEGMPLQYIAGIADFMGEKFIVNENVLIPRPETEILVEKALEKSLNFKNPKILDIGTGSGCIAIMLAKKNPASTVTSCDISLNAIETASQNAKKLSANVEFRKSDIFFNISKKFDIIVSNPPYIPISEKINIQKEVLFEPESALYTSDEYGIEFYERIIAEGKKHLNKNGYILFELGINQSELVQNIFLDYNYTDIEIIKDLDNIDRVIIAKV